MKKSSGISGRLSELKSIQTLQQRRLWINELHPLCKLLVSAAFILITMSYPKYDVAGLIPMAAYLIFAFLIGELSPADGIYRMRLILPLVIFVGVFNPFFDRTPMMRVEAFDLVITGGMISMVTLMIKGIYGVLAAYILIATTSIEDICRGLRMIHVPGIIVTVILLIDRYFIIMGQEAERITNAYFLRAPKQKGIHISAWGTLVGQWLLRSMDRATAVYESMQLRGFKGDFSISSQKFKASDIAYAIIFVSVFFIFRYTNFL